MVCSRPYGPLLLVALALVPSVAAAQCDAEIDLGRGPVGFHVPSSYDAEVPAPLVIQLHGRGTNGFRQELYMGFTPFAEEFGYIYAYPDALPDPLGVLTWNGTDACCDFGRLDIDDSGYLRQLIEAFEAQCNIDPRKIFITGHSNGGFMSYRMACDHADRVAAIASLAGATYLDPDDCSPSEPVHVLQIHGTEDRTIRYAGGINGGVLYPGAVESAETWAGYNGCALEPQTSPDHLDLDLDVVGAETIPTRYTEACTPGGSAAVWTVEDGGHVPALDSTYPRSVSEFLLAHPKAGLCDGGERVKAKRCTRSNKLILKLRSGLARDGYRVELSSGEAAYGVLSGKGRAKVKFSGLEDAEGTAIVTYGCGAVVIKEYDCG